MNNTFFISITEQHNKISMIYHINLDIKQYNPYTPNIDHIITNHTIPFSTDLEDSIKSSLRLLLFLHSEHAMIKYKYFLVRNQTLSFFLLFFLYIF